MHVSVWLVYKQWCSLIYSQDTGVPQGVVFSLLPFSINLMIKGRKACLWQITLSIACDIRLLI